MQTYCEIDDVTTFAKEHSHDYWTNLSNDYKERYIQVATTDIEVAHGQPRSGEDPWRVASFLDECVLQSLFLARTFGMRLTSEHISQVTGGSYSDGVLSVESRETPALDPIVKVMVENKLKRFGINLNEFGRS